MRLCRKLGGPELPIVAQIEAPAALAAGNAASAWCTMVANNAVAVLGATMPAATVKRVFADGVPACSIVAGPGGVATPVAGGFTLTGTRRLASSIHHADWIHATALVGRDPSRILPMAVPARNVTLLDSWHVVGLAGTGSNDFTLQNYFLSSELAGRKDEPYGQVRGVRRYDLVELEYLESYEHLAFALGIGGRVLREMWRVLTSPLSGRHIADREMVQGRFGQLPTGVTAIVTGAATGPVDLIVGTFSSVSLDPPLLSLIVTRNSRSWLAVRARGRLTANILASDQRALSQKLAGRSPDKFRNVAFESREEQLISGCLAWATCTLEREVDAGDHTIVLATPCGLTVARATRPLIFFQRAHHRTLPVEDFRAPGWA